MSTNVQGWTTLAETPLVLVREYRFGPGTANALAVRMQNGQLLIVSPPCGVAPDELKSLEQQGKVTALLAINGAHHLGLGPCRKAFPEAKTYAAPAARDRILKRNKDAGDIEPLGALQPLLGDTIRVIAVDGCKLGDVLIGVETERGNILYASDFIANIQTLPKNLLFKLAFRLTDSGPGLKVFRLFFKFFARNPALVRDVLIREIEVRPPAVMVPAHGDVVSERDLGATLVGMLRRAI
jgi:hypothetical protein